MNSGLNLNSDVPVNRNVQMNRFALFGQCIFIVLGIKFLPVNATISLRRHQDDLRLKRIKTFELVKADVTLCLAAVRVLLVLCIVDLPKINAQLI